MGILYKHVGDTPMNNFLNSIPQASKKDTTSEGSQQPTLPCEVRADGPRIVVTWDLSQIDGTPNTGHIRLTARAKAPYVTLDTPDRVTVEIDGTPVSVSCSGMRINAYLKRVAAGQSA